MPPLNPPAKRGIVSLQYQTFCTVLFSAMSTKRTSSGIVQSRSKRIRRPKIDYFTSVPTEVIQFVLVPYLDIPSLNHVSYTNKCFNAIHLPATNATLQQRYFSFLQEYMYDHTLMKINPNYYQSMFEVWTNRGCMMCKKARIRKVYFEFRRRMCVECLYAHTINEYYLDRDYGLRPSTMRATDIWRMTTEIWCPASKSTTPATYYWKPMVNLWLETIRNTTLAELGAIEAQRVKDLQEQRAREQQEKEEKRQERLKKRMEKEQKTKRILPPSPLLSLPDPSPVTLAPKSQTVTLTNTLVFKTFKCPECQSKNVQVNRLFYVDGLRQHRKAVHEI
jgi:hypothetical protein